MKWTWHKCKCTCIVGCEWASRELYQLYPIIGCLSCLFLSDFLIMRYLLNQPGN